MLSDDHRKFLREQAVDEELAEKLGVRSLLSREDTADLGEAWENWANFPAILFPWTSPDGRVEYQVRPDNPTKDHRGRDRKYVFRKGMTPVLWAVAPIIDSTVDVLIVEGTKQCLAAASNLPDGAAVYGISGCRSWQKDGEPIPDLAELRGWDVTVVLDADAAENPEVYDAGTALAKALTKAGAVKVSFGRLPGGGKSGLDDVLGGLTEEADRPGFLARLIEEAGESPADERPKGDEAEPATETLQSVWVDLGPYLDGTYAPPEPEIGAARQPDGKRLLYAGKWHTVIGLTGCGKTWFACVQAAAELAAGNTVVYAHFEESSPAGTVARLLGLGVPVDVIRARLRWVDQEHRAGYAKAVESLEPAPSLVVLDGINAACGTQSPNDVETVTRYRKTYVNPATRVGASVLSLGHPVKDVNRQGERHSYGSTAWLDLADGVGLRLEAGPARITRGAKGTASIYSVKDRYGGVEQGEPDAAKKEGWKWLGTLSVDDTGAEGTKAVLLAPTASQAAPGDDRLDDLCHEIVLVLTMRDGNRYESQGELGTVLQARSGRTVRKEDLGAALVRLEDRGLLQRTPVDPRRPNKARAGWLTSSGLGWSKGSTGHVSGLGWSKGSTDHDVSDEGTGYA